MHSIAVGIKLADGKRELAFIRNPDLLANPEVVAKLTAHFETRRRVQKAVEAIPDNTPRDEVEKLLPDLLKQYGSALNRIVAFERTGFAAGLDDPGFHEEKLAELSQALMNTCQKSFSNL